MELNSNERTCVGKAIKRNARKARAWRGEETSEKAVEEQGTAMERKVKAKLAQSGLAARWKGGRNDQMGEHRERSKTEW